MAETLLYKIDTLVADGIALEIEESSVSIEGPTRFENKVVLAANGADAQSRQRVPCMIKARILFKASTDPEQLAGMRDVQMTVRDTQSGKRALATNCSFASMGAVGAGGPVDITWNVLSPLQWL